MFVVKRSEVILNMVVDYKVCGPDSRRRACCSVVTEYARAKLRSKRSKHAIVRRMRSYLVSLAFYVFYFHVQINEIKFIIILRLILLFYEKLKKN